MRFSDDARRARLARRHGLHPEHRPPSPEAVAAAMVALHATEAASVHLAVAVRSNDVGVADVERALYLDRTLVKQLAMRRTLFAFPRDLLPAVWASASARVAAQQRSQLERDLVRHGVTDDPAAWLQQARLAVLDRLAPGEVLSARQLREALPELAGRTVRITDSRWALADTPFAPRVLTWLGAEHLIVRGTNQGHWRLGRPGWTSMTSWLGTEPQPLTSREGYAGLISRWLWTFGPGTEDDLVWWLGSTKAAVRAALADLNAVPVELDSGDTGYLLPGDDEPDAPVTPWAALLPTLDSTLMGWRQRDFYLDPDLTPYLFDSNGNGGTTAWLSGWVVGCWVQNADGSVRVLPARPMTAAEGLLLNAEAERLTAFLNGVRITNVYSSLMMKGESLR